MKKVLSFLTAGAITASMLAGCGKKASGDVLKPLMGLSWFDGYDSVKTELDSYTLIREREDSGDTEQKMLDYADISLFDMNCDLTLCFTDNGLVGLNYHDIRHNQGYRSWMSTLEEKYGLPTESGTGMASWYDNPLGKDTVVYLFNLQEGVQVSFYASADAPDKSYEKERKPYIPTPEIRSPVVPVTDDEEVPSAGVQTQNADSAGSLPAAEILPETEPDERPSYQVYPSEEDVSETEDKSGSDVTKPEETEKNTAAVTTAANEKTVATSQTSASTSVQTTTTVTTTVPVRTETQTQPDRSKDFLVNDIGFYGSADSERKKMSGYTQIYEYKTEEPGQPWEIIMEYENVPYLDKKCDAVLCFTSLGLVGINYFDPSKGSYSYWVKQFISIYGEPDEVQYDYSAWTNSPVGKGTEMYIFSLDDGVQISFFTDDTGSEMS